MCGEGILMLYLLGEFLIDYFGPARLLTSHLNLIILGLTAGFVGVIYLLPKLLRFLPLDRGREYAIDAESSVGKPTGAGVVFIPVFLLLAVLVVPPDARILAILFLTLAAMVSGFLDDKSRHPWGELSKGLLDLGLALAAAFLLYSSEVRTIWLPFTNTLFETPMWFYVPLATTLIWVSINTTNCSDGVDGVSSTLVLIALLCTGTFLYLIVGHADFSSYLLLPHYVTSAKWAITSFTLVGSLAGYLWYNAYPSHVLMGDAGSRALGFIMGVMIMNTGNPFLILIVASVIIINGGTGLVKVGLLRFFKIRIFHTIRFPLHDHFRKDLNWSNTQVLIRFALIQVLVTIALIGITVKVR
jgi:phospho-N-acetylmuramoyl-pentapeptide-transferase